MVTAYGWIFDDGVSHVMRFNYSPSDLNSGLGYVLPHGVPNAGVKANQYSPHHGHHLLPASSTGFRSLFQTETNSADDGDVFVNDSNGIGISSQYQGDLTFDEWHRVVLTFDLTKRELGKYIDGTNVLTGPVGSSPGTGPYQYLSTSSGGVDGRWAMNPIALLFADEDGEIAAGSVSSIQTRPVVLTPSQIAQMGRPTSTGIPVNITPLPPLSIFIGAFGTPVISWPAHYTDYILERSTSLAPGATWTEIVDAIGNFYEEFAVAEPAFFYRLRKVR